MAAGATVMSLRSTPCVTSRRDNPCHAARHIGAGEARDAPSGMPNEDIEQSEMSDSAIGVACGEII